MILSEGLNSDEIKIRKKLDKYLLGQNESSNNRPEDAESIAALRRFQAKLKLRETKRLRHLKLFDIDSYTNELIDRERANKPTKDQQQDEDVIFEFKTLKTNMYDTNIVKPEVIEVTRVLDRFKSKNHHHVMMNQRENFYFLNRMPIGMVEWRNEDVKCIFSPFSNKMLKPYIWRDFKTMPPRLEINNEMKKRGKKESDEMKSSSSIDYVYLRPEHVLPINMMCEEHFWNGIDISECLQYPDLTIVALYKKLIVGFALLTPPSTQSSTTTINENKEMYLSFIFVHPDWREAKRKSTQKSGADQHVSIAQYMLYYLIKKCDCDVILHVSVNSPAVILYQKFGFQIEEFIQDFYDKYYSSEQNRSKDAFLMKFSR